MNRKGLLFMNITLCKAKGDIEHFILKRSVFSAYSDGIISSRDALLKQVYLGTVDLK